jgi:hypothetical protein
LPPGATGEAFSFPIPNGAATVPATAIYAGDGTAEAPNDLSNAQCDLSASQPSFVATDKQVQGIGSVEGNSCFSFIENKLTVKLWTTGGGGNYTQRGPGSKTFFGTGGKQLQTACYPKNQNWHTQAILDSVDTQNGDEEDGYVNSDRPDPLIPC